MSKLPLDLKHFKKVSSDEHTSTFQHYAGHKIVIAHKKLSTKMREKLSGIPTSRKKMAQGGFMNEEYSSTEPEDREEDMGDPGDQTGADKNEPMGHSPIFDQVSQRYKAQTAMAGGGTVHEAYDEESPGVSKAGDYVRQMVPPGMTKTPMEARGDRGFLDKAKSEHHKVLSAIQQSKNKDRKYMAEGGQADVSDDDDDSDSISNYDRQPAAVSRSTDQGNQVQVSGPSAQTFGPSASLASPQDMDQQSPASITSGRAGDDAIRRLKESDAIDRVRSDVAQEDASQAQPQQQPQEPAQQQMPEPTATESITPPTFEDHKAAAKNVLTQEQKDWQNDLDNGHITPSTYAGLFAKKDTLGKIGTLFGLLVSGMGAGNGPNPVLEMMHNELDNDMKAQQESKGNAQNFLRIAQAGLLNNANISQKKAETALTQNRADQIGIDNQIEALKNQIGLEGSSADVQKKNIDLQTLSQLNQAKLSKQQEEANLTRAQVAGTNVNTGQVAQTVAKVAGIQASLHALKLDWERETDPAKKQAKGIAYSQAAQAASQNIANLQDITAATTAGLQGTGVLNDQGNGQQGGEQQWQQQQRLRTMVPNPGMQPLFQYDKAHHLPGLGQTSVPVNQTHISSWNAYNNLQKGISDANDYLQRASRFGEKIPGSMKAEGEGIETNLITQMKTLENLGQFTQAKLKLYEGSIPDLTGTHFTDADKTKLAILQKRLDENVNSFTSSVGAMPGAKYKKGTFYRQQGNHMVPVNQ